MNRLVPRYTKPHLYFDVERGKWRMSPMPADIRGNATGRWARGHVYIFNKNKARKGKRK